jgi:hypothetical protein
MRDRDRLRRLSRIICLLSIVATPASAATKYVVDAVEGRFDAWSPSAAQWNRMKKGEVYPTGTVVQTLSAGSLRLRRTGEKTSEGVSGGVTLQTDKGLIVRLTEELARTVVASSFYADSMPDSTSGKAKSAPETSIASAWKRVSALLMAKGNAGVKKGATAGASSEAQKGKEESGILDVPLANPKNGSILVTDRLPAVLAMRWVPPTSGLYEVRLGERESDALPLVGVSAKGYLVAPLFHEGSYTLEVLAKDGQSASKRVHFHLIMTPGGKGT